MYVFTCQQQDIYLQSISAKRIDALINPMRDYTITSYSYPNVTSDQNTRNRYDTTQKTLVTPFCPKIYKQQMQDRFELQLQTQAQSHKVTGGAITATTFCDQSVTLKKPRKQFKTIQERNRFVHQYKLKYKTEQCKNWELTGNCKYLDNCSFAHGNNELKGKIHVHKNYKTKICYQFHSTGYCPYGNRCQFLHSQYNLKSIGNSSNSNSSTSGEDWSSSSSSSSSSSYRLVFNENILQTKLRMDASKNVDHIYVNVFPTDRLNIFKSLTKT